MSGQAGSSRREKYYSVDYRSGMYVNIATPPWENNPADYVAREFRMMSAPYEEMLARAVPLLNNLFEGLKAGGSFPLAEFEGERQWIDGIIIEDALTGDRAMDRHGEECITASGGCASYVRVSTDIHSVGMDMVEITFAVNRRILRSEINPVLERIRDIFRAL